jgi:hypothetical protein
MLNKAPIFINGFNRGGTNLMQFLIASHPEVCLLGREAHELFYGKSNEPIRKWFDRLRYLPVFLSTRQHMFYTRNLEIRNRIPRIIGQYIDWLFFQTKIGSVMNRVKDEKGMEYSKEEVKAARLLCKNTNGVVFTSKELQCIYPDATFIALVRNGLALCESYTRRGWSAREFGKMYEQVCQKMIRDKSDLEFYKIVRFEDMVDAPAIFVRDIYNFANLNLSQVTKFGLKAKRSMDKNGVRKLMFGTEKGTRVWVSLENLSGHLRKDVNQNQINQLQARDKYEFLKQAENSMKYFGYL